MKLDTNVLTTLADDLSIEEENLRGIIKVLKTEDVTGAVVFREATQLYLKHIHRFRQATEMEVRSRRLGG